VDPAVLLIDNRHDLVDAWQATGGAGYWFGGDEQFARDERTHVPRRVRASGAA
jgi:hypothetical protein